MATIAEALYQNRTDCFQMARPELHATLETKKADVLRRLALDELDTLWEFLRSTVHGHPDSRAVLSRIDVILEQLETTNEELDAQGLGQSLSRTLHRVLVSNLPAQDDLEVLDLIIRSLSLNLSSGPESERDLALALSQGIVLHMQRLASPSLTTDSLQQLKIILEYHARTQSLGLGDNNSDVPSKLAAIAKSRFERFIESSKRALSEGAPTKRSESTHVESTCGSVAALDIGIECMTHAIALGEKFAKDLPCWLDVLALMHQNRSYLPSSISTSVADISKAIQVQSRALALSRTHLEYNRRMSHLAALFINRSILRAEGTEDLVIALDLHPHALPPSLKEKERLMNYLTQAKMLEHRLTSENSCEAVEQAIGILSKARNFFASHLYLFQAALLSRIGTLRERLFLISGGLADIEEAIEFHKRALLLISEQRGETSPFLLPLIQGLSRKSHYLRDRKIGDSVHSGTAAAPELGMIELHHLLVGGQFICPGVPMNPSMTIVTLPWLEYALSRAHTWSQTLQLGHKDTPLCLSYLSRLYLDKFIRTYDMDDLHSAIKHMDQAVSLDITGHSRIVGWLDELAKLYDRRYTLSLNGQDFEMAIRCAMRALTLLPPNHGSTPEYLSSIGAIYSHRAHSSGSGPQSDGARTEAESYFRQAAYFATGFPFSRLKAVMTWVSASVSTAGWENSAHEAFEIAMTIFPHVSWLCAGPNKKLEGLRLTTRSLIDFTENASAWYFSRGEVAIALEWIELSRSVVHGNISNLQPIIDKLLVQNPYLVDKIHKARNELYHAAVQSSYSETSNQGPLEIQMMAIKCVRLVDEFNWSIQDVRGVPGCRNFLLPMRALELSRAANSGPIVVVNTTRMRCDAVILAPGQRAVTHLVLPDVSTERLIEGLDRLDWYVQQHHAESRGVRKGKQKEVINNDFEQLLNFLWSAIVHPILDVLGYLHVSNKELPHLTWCTTGLLSSLPLHAAGYYDRSWSKVGDFVVSSYTPTLGALLPTPLVSPPHHSELLAIGQEHSADRKSLPGTEQELSVISKYAERSFNVSRLDNADAVCEIALEGMEMSDWVHLACHTHLDTSERTASGFVLEDGILSMQSILQRSFKGKGLAFLSGCRGPTREDTAICLASGMLTAGYSSVIATMWGIDDEDGSVMADAVYRRIFKEGGTNCRDSSKALHAAVNELQGIVGAKDFIRWVPYIHVGA